MERSPKEEKDFARVNEFHTKWGKINTIGAKLAVAISIGFIIIGVHVFFTLLPRFRAIQPSGVDDLVIAYGLWCCTFIILGLSTFITGYLMITYHRDIGLVLDLLKRAEEEAKPKEGKEAEKRLNSEPLHGKRR
ncbi:MAG: hypothetical protein AB9903_13755 [Vulcanimicrobiota bacterium]